MTAATLGDNGGPPLDPFAAMALHIDTLIEQAESSAFGNAIATPEQAAQMEVLKGDLKEAVRDMDAARKVEKEPHLEAGKAVDAKWNPSIKRGETAAKTIATLLTPWLQKVDAEKEAIAQAKRDEAAKLGSRCTGID